MKAAQIVNALRPKFVTLVFRNSCSREKNKICQLLSFTQTRTNKKRPIEDVAPQKSSIGPFLDATYEPNIDVRKYLHSCVCISFFSTHTT